MKGVSYIALLRAVNVGGRNKIAMKDLCAFAEDSGLSSPKTLLQSGNLVFTAPQQSADALAAKLTAAAAKDLKLTTQFFVRSAAEWDKLIAANPFPAMAKKDPSHLVAMPLDAKPKAAQVSALLGKINGNEEIAVVGNVLYATYPDGIGRSKLTIAVIESALAAAGTGRNWNTVLKLAELATLSPAR